MYKQTLFLLLAWLAVTPSVWAQNSPTTIELTPAEHAWLAAHPDIRLGTDKNWRPYVKQSDNGDIVGVEPDLLARIKALTGANIRLVLGTWADMVKQAEHGELDGLAISVAQPEREAHFLFSSSLYNISRYIYTRGGNTSPLHSMADLGGKKVAVQQGILVAQKILARWPTIIPVLKDSPRELGVALLNGEVEASMATLALRNILREELTTEIDVAFAVPNSETSILYSIRKEYPELLSIINKALAAIGPAGIREILEKWGANYEAPAPKVVLTEAERAWIKAHPEIRLGGGDGTFMPYVKREDNGNIVGIEPDLLAHINALTGTNLRLVLGPWADLVAQAERGELDGLAISSAQPERAAHFLFSASPYHTSRYIYTRGGASSPLHSMEDLAGKKVGMMRGALVQQKDLARWSSITPVPMDSAKALGLALLNGEIEAVISPIILRQVWRNEMFPGLDIAFPVPNSDTPMVYSIRKEHPELLSIINKALAVIGPAEIRQLLAKWGAIYDTPVTKVDLTDAERAWLATHPDIRLGTDKNWIPYVKQLDNGDIVGIEPDLLARINALTGANLQLVLGKWTEMVAQAERGELHGLAMSAAHPERAERFLFSTSLYSTSRFVYAPSNTTLRSMADLAGKRVGLTAGNLAEQKLLARWPKIIPVPLGSGQELAVALMNHDIDAAVSSITLLRTIRDELLPDLTIAFVVPETETKLLYSIGKEYPELLSIINKALATISPAEVQEILEKWGAVYNAPSTELVLTDEERAWLREHPKIVLGCSDQFQPYLIVKPDGNYEGLVVDYLKLLNQQLGNRLELHVERDWIKVADKAIQHEIDGLAVSSPNPARDQHFLYTEPYNLAYFYLYLRADATNNVTKTADLAGRRVGYLAGVKKIEYLLRDVPNVKLFAFNNNEALVNALLEERVDLLVGTTNLEWWRKQHGNFAFKTAGFLTDSLHPMVMSIRNDWNILPGILNKALNNIPAVEREHIRQRWLNGSEVVAPKNLNQIALNPEELAWLRENRVVHVRVGDFPPYHFWDNGPHGISVELLDHIAKNAGFRIEYLYGTSWTEALQSIRNHAGIDLFPTAKHTPDREDFLAFSKDYLELPWVIFTREKNNSIFSLEDLFGKTIAVEEGYALQKQLTDQYPQIKQIKVREAAAALLAVSGGKVDAYIGNLPVAQYHIGQRGISNLKVAAGTSIGVHTQAFAVRKDWAPLATILDKGLATIPAETRNSINRKYFSLAVTAQVDYTLLWQLAGVALLIIGIILYWNRRLTKEITLRKQTEQQLQDTGERLRSILDSMNDLVFVLDAQGHFLDSYQTRHEHLLVPPEQFLGKHYRDIMPESVAVSTDQAIAVAKQKGAQQYEYSLLMPDGEHWYSVNLSARHNSAGQFDGSTAVVRDVTQRRQDEQQLKENQELLELVFNLNPDSSMITRLTDGIVIKVNEGFTTMSGLAREEIVGQQTLDLDLWENHQDRQHVIEELHSKGICENYEAIFKRTDGSRLVGILSARLFLSQGIPHVITVTRDITERKRVEDALESERSRLHNIIEGTSEGFWLIGVDKRTLGVNAALCRMLGYTREELLGRSPYEFADEKNLAIFLQQHLDIAKTDHRSYEIELRTKSGVNLPTQFNATTLRNAAGQFEIAFAFVTNMSRYKEYEQQLIQAKLEAETANRAKSAFIANMSHELRTPLNAVLGFAQVLLQDSSLESDQRDHVQRIQRGGEYLLTLINDILDLAKIEAGRFELYPAVWNTQAVFQELTYMFRIRAEQRNILFQSESVTPLPQTLYSDDKRLRQVLINLLGNAVKFTERGTVTLRTGYEAGTLCLEVIDSGIGIAPEDLDKILQPFQQTGTNHYKAQGTGLGLAITHRLIQTMGGTLQITSTLGQGSVFRVEIPTEAVSTATEAQPPVDQPTILSYRCTQDRAPVRVLVVDDLEDNREVIRSLLTPLGFHIAEAENGQRCLDIVPTYQPDIIFMDLRMPELNGLDATRALRAQGFYMPIIILSALVFGDDQTATLQAGGTAHLAKPVRLAELLETLAQWLQLEWEYAEAPAPSVNEEEGALETLSQAEAERIRQLALTGDMIDLQEFVGQLATHSPRVSKVLNGLLKSFEFEKILEMIEKYP